MLTTLIVVGVFIGEGAEASHALPLLGSPTLSSISVTPAVASVAQGQTLPFTATGLLSDGTTVDLTKLVTWSSSSGLLASLSNVVGSQGLASGVLPGVSTVTATAPAGLLGLGGLLGGLLGGDLSGTSVLTVIPALVTPVLTAISVSPAVASLAEGQTQQFTATGLLSDLSTQNVTDLVTWSSSSSGLLATVSNAIGSQGLANAVTPGVDAITALAPPGLLGSPLGSLLSGAASLTVTPGAPPPAPSPPLLTLTPTAGRALTAVAAHGTHFAPGGAVTVTYLSGLRARSRASSILCETTVAPDGTFSCGGTIPRRIRSGRRGTHSVVATGVSSTRSAASFLLR